MSIIFVAIYSLLLLSIPCLFMVLLAFLLPLDLASEPKHLNYRPSFALLSVLLGVTFFQFLLWHTRPASFEGVDAILFDLGLAAAVIALWLYGLRLASKQRDSKPPSKVQQIMLFIIALSALVVDTRTAILVGHWAEANGGGSSLFVNVIGIVSLVVTMGLTYRLARSARRERLLKGYARAR